MKILVSFRIDGKLGVRIVSVCLFLNFLEGGERSG